MPDKHSSLQSHTYHSGHEHAFKSPLNGCPSLLWTEPLSRKLNPDMGSSLVQINLPSLGRIWTMLPLTSHLLSYPLPVNQYLLLEGIQANPFSGMSKNVAF